MDKSDKDVVSLPEVERAELRALNQRVADKQAELGRLRVEYLAREAKLVQEIAAANEMGMMRLREICAAHVDDGSSWNLDVQRGTLTRVGGNTLS